MTKELIEIRCGDRDANMGHGVHKYVLREHILSEELEL